LDPVDEPVTRIAGKANIDGLTYHDATDGKQY
jgi:hypothetical protein